MIFESNRFKYSQKTNNLTMEWDRYANGRFPEKIGVRSAVTGKVFWFVPDIELAIVHEFWDGEQTAYMPAEGQEPCGVKNLFLY